MYPPSLLSPKFPFSATIGEIYYAGTQRSTFYDANATCHDLGGQVLRYGMVFIDALVKCHQYIYAWTGLPFYEQLRKFDVSLYLDHRSLSWLIRPCT